MQTMSKQYRNAQA